MSARFATDMVSAFGSFTIGSAEVLSLRISASQTRRTQYRLTINLTRSSGLGSPIQYIYHHAKRKQHEVHYARHVGTPSFLTPPSGLGISTRLTGCGW